MKKILLTLAVLAAVLGGTRTTAAVAPPTTPPTSATAGAVPLGPPIVVQENAGVTVSILGVHVSTAAGAIVVVAEVATTVQLEGSGYASYVSPSGVQVETAEYFDIMDTVFPGVTKVVAWSFASAEPGGVVYWSVYGPSFDDISFTLDLGGQ